MSTLFGALLAAGLYFAHEPKGSGQMPSVSGIGGLSGAGKAAPLVGAAGLGPSDPVVRFADTRIGQVLFSKSRSDDCVRVLFNNVTGDYYEAKDIFCGRKPEPPSDGGPSRRLDALRKSFAK
jgi:hypothetical protein